MIGSLTSHLSAIPASFWGVIAGSFFSLGGVYLSNRANDRRLIKQLNHDRELKTKDRELALRKEIYLAAAEAISAGINSITKYGNLDLEHDEISGEYSSKSAAIAKVYVIANSETIAAITRITDELSTIFLHLSAKRIPLVRLKSKARILQEQISKLQDESNRFLELMKQYNLEGKDEPHRWKTIQGNFNFQSEQIDKIQKDLEAASQKLIAENIVYLKECVAEEVRIRPLLTPVLIAARAELDIPLDEANYIKIITGSTQTQEARAYEFLDRIEAESKASHLL